MTLGEALGGTAGLVSLAVALALLLRAPAHRATRVFAFVLVFSGLAAVLRWGVTAWWPEMAVAGAAASRYFYLPLPFLLLGFALLYPTPRGKVGRSPWTLPLLVAVGLALDVAFLVDHELYVTRTRPGLWDSVGPLFLVRIFDPVLKAVIALVFVRDAVRGRTPAHETSLLLIAAALAIEPAYNGTRDLSGALIAFRPPLEAVPTTLLPLAPVAAMLVLLARHASRAEGGPRVVAYRALGLVAAGPLGGIAVAAMGWAGDASFDALIFGVPAGLYAIASPLLVAYALLRHRLFDIDLRVKQSFPAGTVAAAFVAVFALATEAGQAMVGFEAAPYVGIAAAAVVVAAVPPLRRAGTALADRALPGIRDSPDYLNARRLEVYCAALEEVYAPGASAPAVEPEGLVRLRRELGVTEREHAALKFALQSGRGAPRARPVAGTVLLGRYRVVRSLGNGSAGEVWLARDERTGQEVALKGLAGHRRRDAAAVRRFEREVRLVGALRHPNLVAMERLETVGDDAYLVMEYVPGGSLAERLGGLSEAEAVAVARDVLAALGSLHAEGIVHRDVKPSNILLTPGGHAKLGDFTIAQGAVSGETVGLAASPGAGTLAYMAPEQARGVGASARSDLYAVGATLYAALAGQPPIPVEGLSEFEARRRVAEAQPALPLPGVSPGLNRVLARVLAKEPGARYPSAAAMAKALERAGPG